MDDAAAVSEVLDERPELEDPLRAVLDVDDENEAWTFDDLPIDSGAFGELVSRGLVEKTDDGDAYHVANPDAVRAALEEEAESDAAATGADASPSPTSTSASTSRWTPDLPTWLSVPSLRRRLTGVDRVTLGSLLGALFVVVLARAYVYGSVFRDGAVVLSGNDPYYYRYWVEQALAASGGALDFSGLATMSNAVQTGEPLLVATLWFFSSLFGGDATAAGWVLAWYPVVAAVITAYLVYRLTMVVTDDRRVALAALVLLAVTPAHAFRTSLGFADHHAFDYVWLMLTAYATVRLEFWTDANWREGGQWVWAVVLGLGIAGQILAWDAGPLLLVPFGLYVALRTLHDVRSDVSPVTTHRPLVAGVVLGAVLVYLAHALVGWHSGTVAFTPILMALGVVGTLVAGELANRYGMSVGVLAGVELVGSIVGLLALRTFRPDYWGELMHGIDRITASRNIAETQSLLSGDTLGWLLLFGFVLALAVPFLIWESVEAYRGRGEWLVPVVYGWYFLLLAMYQVRFAGQLAMFASVFAGLGFVYLAATVGLTERPVPLDGKLNVWSRVSLPSWGTIGQFVVLFLLVSGLSIVQVPIKTSQVVTNGDQYRMAEWMNGYAEERTWEYPENYVFNQWGQNRMYNYFVNGESDTYTYAIRHYSSFLSSTNLTSWHKQLINRAGFIVTEDQFDLGQATIYSYLHNHYGGTGARLESQGLFRTVYETEDGSYKVFSPVKGALIAGRTSANKSGVVSTEVNLPDSSFVYNRQVTATENGWYMLRVPYATTYDTIGNDTVSVEESEVYAGSIANNRVSSATWPMSAGRGDYAFDHRGGNHGQIVNSEWKDGEGWKGLSFNGNGFVEIPEAKSIDGSDGFTLSVRFRIRESVNYKQDVQFPRIVSKAPSSAFRGTDGFQITLGSGRLMGILGNGSSTTRVSGGEISKGRWYNTTLTWDGSLVQLYVNGELVDTGSFTGSVENDVPLVFGASSSGHNHFVGSIDTVHYNES